MKNYQCDLCGKSVDEKTGITESRGLVKFKIPGNGNAYAGLHLELQSGGINDICRDCINQIVLLEKLK